MQIGQLDKACKKAQQEAEEQGAAVHAAQLQMQAREQSVLADLSSQDKTLRMLQKDLREALSLKASLQQQVRSTIHAELAGQKITLKPLHRSQPLIELNTTPQMLVRMHFCHAHQLVWVAAPFTKNRV